MAAEMEDLARTMPGFVDVKAFKSDDGERLTVVWWENEETLKGWRENVRHRLAQRLGREQWYEYYKIEVAEVVRQNAFTRAVCIPSSIRRSFFAPRHQRIDAASPSGRDVRVDVRRSDQEHSYADEGDRIGRPHAAEKPGDRLRSSQ